MDHTATFSPQDNKLRLYFASRIPKDEWSALKTAGFSWCMKQSQNGGCDMVATWTPAREDTCLAMCGEVGDEDQPREERAADRAERFDGYRENRVADASGLADRYDGSPKVFGNQDAGRAERQAARVDRVADRAVSQWSKAEYWQTRTAGVISHAKYLERPEVRFRRMKGYESDLRRQGGESGTGRWANHYRLLLAYERQMLDAQGGAGVTEVQVVAGGFYGSRQVMKVSKDRAGRVSKVYVWGPHPWKQDGSLMLRGLDAEDMKMDGYRAPTADEAAAFKAKHKAKLAAKPKAPSLLTLSEEDAGQLQATWNEAKANEYRASMKDRYAHRSWQDQVEKEVVGLLAVGVKALTQARYSDNSGGSYSACRTVDVAADWTVVDRWNHKPVAFRVRVANSGTCYAAPHVVVLTDKKANPLPALAVTVAPVKVEAVMA